MAESLYFNCGELKPGLRRITLPRPPSPPTIIVNPSRGEPRDPPFIPVPGEPTYPQTRTAYKCVDVKLIYCPQDITLPIQKRRIKLRERKCVQCTVIPGTNIFPPECKYDNLFSCEPECSSVSGPCDGGGPTTPGGSTRGPITQGGGPSTGGPITGGIIPIIPAGGPTRTTLYKCIQYRTIYCREDFNLPVSQRRIELIEKRCVACPPPTGNASYPPECSYVEPTCLGLCANISGTCGPRGPITTSISTGIAGPITGPIIRKWECRTYSQVPCPNNLGIIQSTLQRCFECTPNEYGQFPQGCVHDSEAACTLECPREIIVAECPSGSTSVSTGTVSTGGQTTNTGSEGGSQSIPIATLNSRGSIVTNNETSVTVGSIIIAPPNVGVEIPRTNQVDSIDLDNLEQQRRINQSYSNTTIPNKLGDSIYHPDYNFYKNNPTEETKLVSNSKYLNIFSNVVAEEVYYAIQRQNTDLPWNESFIFNLTTEKLIISLNTSLLKAINNIHYLGNQIVDSNLIVLGLKRLLLTGKLDEFNPDYYVTLSKNQSSDTVVKFEGTSNPIKSERVALGVIAEDAIAAQATKNNDLVKELLKRQKRLNTDIEANFTIQNIEGDNLRFDLKDAGTQYVKLNSENKHVLIGDGDGYYVVIEDINDTDKALVLDTKVSSTYYSPPDVRYNAMTLLKEDPSIYFTVSSTSANEFTSDYDNSSVPDLLFFGVELDTIESITKENPLVDVTKVKYKKLNQSEIEYYTLNYGLSITRANINYDDPFLYYARDTSTLIMEQSDITFRNFDRNRTIVGENILSRNIPFGIILTPGCGSQHNPFAGFSELDSYDGSTVVRTVGFIPDINVNKNRITSPSLEFSKLYGTQNKTSIGLIEEKSFESAVFNYNPNSYIFNNRFYKNGFVESVTNTKEFGYSNFVKKINLLKQNYDIDELTWWDIFRRLNFNEINRYIYDNNPELTVNIIAGLLGPTIRRVLARLDPNETTLLIPNESLEEDKIILTARDR